MLYIYRNQSGQIVKIDLRSVHFLLFLKKNLYTEGTEIKNRVALRTINSFFAKSK